MPSITLDKTFSTVSLDNRILRHSSTNNVFLTSTLVFVFFFTVTLFYSITKLLFMLSNTALYTGISLPWGDIKSLASTCEIFLGKNLSTLHYDTFSGGKNEQIQDTSTMNNLRGTQTSKEK